MKGYCSFHIYMSCLPVPILNNHFTNEDVIVLGVVAEWSKVLIAVPWSFMV